MSPDNHRHERVGEEIAHEIKAMLAGELKDPRLEVSVIVSEVRAGYECGLGIANFNDVKVGDILECFQVVKVSAAEAAGQTPAHAGRSR